MACSNLSLLTLGCFAPHPILIHEVSVLDIFTYSDNSLDFGALIILLDNVYYFVNTLKNGPFVLS